MNVFERFFSISSELFVVTSDGGKIEHVNPRWSEVLGYESGEILGRTVYSLLHPDDIENTRRARERAGELGEYGHLENRLIHKTGTIVWMKWHLTVDAGTRLVFATGADVTAEKQALQNLELVTAIATNESSSLVQERERSTILRQLIETAKDGFGYCAPNGRPLYLNRFLVEELGWSPDGTSIFDFLPPASRSRCISETVPAVLNRRESWEGELEFMNLRDGTLVPIWLKAFCSLNSEGRPQYVAFFATDLRTKRQAEAAIFHSSKMASLGQMAAGIAHEVNNPITIIHGTAGLLKKAIQSEIPDFEKITKGLERIEKTSLRISRIIKGLRMFSRSGENDPPLPIPLGTILEETLDLCRERFRDYAIDLRIDDVPEVSVRCRPTQISQVLLNLLNNSFDAISRESDRWVRIDFAEIGEFVRVSVTDSGPGLTPETQRRLMEPFFTTKEPGKGTGLGLPISRGIIEEHGGKLLYDREAKNTCFAIELPCERASGPPVS